MQIIFDNKDLQYIYEHGKEKRKPRYPFEVIRSFVKKITIMINLQSTEELRQYKSLNFEQLKGDLKGFYSIRVNDQYRIVFSIDKKYTKAIVIEIVHILDLTDYH